MQLSQGEFARCMKYKVCARPACPDETEPGSSYCHPHAVDTARRLQSRRSRSRRSFYDDPQWQAVSRRRLTIEPACRECDRPANQADHVIPVEAGGAPYDLTNTQSLCAVCHGRKSATSDGAFGNTRSVYSTSTE